MRSFEDYQNKLRSMRRNIYMGGKVISRDDPQLMGPMNNIKLTFDYAQDDKYKGLVTATSHLSSKEINRFTHIHRSQEDLLKKQEMTRTLCRKTPACIQRCMGVDMLNAISIFTHEIDQAKGTQY